MICMLDERVIIIWRMVGAVCRWAVLIWMIGLRVFNIYIFSIVRKRESLNYTCTKTMLTAWMTVKLEVFDLTNVHINPLICHPAAPTSISLVIIIVGARRVGPATRP